MLCHLHLWTFVPRFFFPPSETGYAPIAAWQPQLCKPTPHRSYRCISLYTRAAIRTHTTPVWRVDCVCCSECFLLFMHVCMHMSFAGHIALIISMHRFVHSHRSGQRSISLLGCAAPMLRWGRWGRPCPPLCWSAEGSYAAPPPWTRSPAAGCLSAPPPPHRRVPLGCWQTGWI